VGLIRETGASAAYWAISSADKIFASKNSDVGSIGVTMSYLSNVEKNKKDGYTFEQVSIGKYKDSGYPNKPLTSEEKALFLRDSNIIYENFVKAVSQNRKIPINKVKGFADGSTVLGEKAKSLSLINEIGGIDEVEKYLEEVIGEKPEICWQ
jgi:protease-4